MKREAIIAQMRKLAEQLAELQPTPLAVVLIEPKQDGYEDVAPQLLMEDVCCAANGAWPQGFSVTLLNPSS